MSSELSPAAPDVTVVISTYNRSDQLRLTLESLLGQQTEGLTWEAVVVDNNSTDATRAVVELFVPSIAVMLPAPVPPHTVPQLATYILFLAILTAIA